MPPGLCWGILLAMIDLHMHTLFSDGELLPAELVRRCRVAGFRAMAITDHVDGSNVEFVVENIARFCDEGDHGLRVLPGVEITHVRPSRIADIAERARKAGAKIIVVHGETVVEPVEEGTNLAAIDAGVDIIAHPGMISEELAERAAAAGVALEISGRGGHEFTNGHVARMAREAGATLVFNSDTHKPRDIFGRDMALQVVIGAGLTEYDALEVLANSEKIVEAKSGAL